jgi:translation initiation factor 2 subunit 2
MNYEQMLKKGKKSLPEVKKEKARFDIPKVRGHIQGNKTVISNFSQIAQFLHRPVQHMLKYVQKGLATPGEVKKTAVIFGTKMPASKLNEKIKEYADEFVICRECGKPDTKLTKEGDIYYLKCQACGAKYSFYVKI